MMMLADCHEKDEELDEALSLYEKGIMILRILDNEELVKDLAVMLIKAASIHLQKEKFAIAEHHL